jgi:hypothetical protein
MAGENDEEHKEPKFPPTRTHPNQPTSLSTMAISSTANSTQATTPPPPSCALLHCLSCCRSVVVMSLLFVMLMTSVPHIHATASPGTPSSLKSVAAQSDHQHHEPSPSPVPTISSFSTMVWKTGIIFFALIPNKVGVFAVFLGLVIVNYLSRSVTVSAMLESIVKPVPTPPPSYLWPHPLCLPPSLWPPLLCR